MSDYRRKRQLYSFLLHFAAVYKKSSINQGEKDRINFRQTSIRLRPDVDPHKVRSDYARGIYDFVHGINSNYPEPETLTTENLVNKLASIFEALEKDLNNPTRTGESPKPLRKEEIIQLFAYLITFSPEEKDKLKGLGFSPRELDIILQQSLLNFERYCTPEQREEVIKLYKISLGLKSGKKDKLNKESLPGFIAKKTEAYLDNLGWKKWSKKEEKIGKLSRIINRHISRIESQMGIGEFPSSPIISKPRSLTDCVDISFIENLIDSVIENTLNREEIPLFFQYFNIEQVEPLPLFYPDKIGETTREGLLNPSILLDQSHDNTGLASQYSYKVTVSFNLRIKDRDFLETLKNNLPKEARIRLIQDRKEGLVFEVTSSGVGGQMSQLLKVINRALLWDIDCLRERYFPIAHDLVIYQNIINNNIASPVWSHNLVRLCRTEHLAQALLDEKFYDECADIDEVAKGDYFGFNFWESVAKSAILARISAILKTYINPNQYINDLAKTVSKREIIRIAKDYLDYYPFSLTAMESYIKSNILDKYDDDDDDDKSYFRYDAYLHITMAYLREGLYRKAYSYLHEMSHLELYVSDLSNINSDKFKIFSGATLAEYELCKAYYFYLYDGEQDLDIKYRWNGLPNYERANLVDYSWRSLEKAEKHLTNRITKYLAINEITQSIFHPYFIILARINLLKAKLFLFFPSYAQMKFDKDNEQEDYNYSRLYFLELSRIYAAKNGNTVDYACYSAYQAFAYIVTGYQVNQEKYKISSSNRTINFSRNECLSWAKKLINHALIHYGEFGKQCYYQIKAKSGASYSINCDQYGDCEIEKIPLIQEEIIQEEENEQEKRQGWLSEDELCNENSLKNCENENFSTSKQQNNRQKNAPEGGILFIDMSLLYMKTLDDSNEELEEPIYLFGARVAIILFARAMYQLCSDDNIQDINSWKKKVNKAYRLFTYAWAVAENGGETQKIELDNSDIKFKIVRPYFKKQKPAGVSLPPEAESVMDLYPSRQSEIADLGKIFAISCRLLLIYLVDQEKKDEYEIEIKKILKYLQHMPPNNSKNIEDQPTYNGHLQPYLKKIKSTIETELNIAKKEQENINMEKIRERILGRFFDF